MGAMCCSQDDGAGESNIAGHDPSPGDAHQPLLGDGGPNAAGRRSFSADSAISCPPQVPRPPPYSLLFGPGGGGGGGGGSGGGHGRRSPPRHSFGSINTAPSPEKFFDRRNGGRPVHVVRAALAFPGGGSKTSTDPAQKKDGGAAENEFNHSPSLRVVYAEPFGGSLQLPGNMPGMTLNAQDPPSPGRIPDRPRAVSHMSYFEPECIICFEPFTTDNPRVKSKCRCSGETSNPMHLGCLYAWVEQQDGNQICPVCRSPLAFEEEKGP